MSSEKDRIDIFSAISMPIIAAIVAFVTWLQWDTNEKKRKQDLFDKRYTFYSKLKELYIEHAREGERFDFLDFVPAAEEARFLFGKDIEKHVLAIPDRKVVDEAAAYIGIVEGWFIRPFLKYLALK